MIYVLEYFPFCNLEYFPLTLSIKVELLCDMVVPFEESAAVDRDTTAKINKESVRAFVLSCLRAGVRLDLKPRKSSAGLVAHVRRVAAA